MKNIGNIIKTLQNILRKDQGVSGDAQRIEQLGWMISLKILDDKDQELEMMHDDYQSPIPDRLKWRNWAQDAEGLTGDPLRDFIEKDLFPTLKNLEVSNDNKRAIIVKEIFEGTNNYMKNGTIIRQVLNKLNEIDFNNSQDRHIFGDIYENILRDLQSAGNYGEFYTPRALTEIMTELLDPQLHETLLDPACGTGGFLTCAIEHIRRQGVNTADALRTLQANVRGSELKPLPFMLAVTNLILHDIEVPNIDYADSLNREYTSIKERVRVRRRGNQLPACLPHHRKRGFIFDAHHSPAKTTRAGGDCLARWFDDRRRGQSPHPRTLADRMQSAHHRAPAQLRVPTLRQRRHQFAIFQQRTADQRSVVLATSIAHRRKSLFQNQTHPKNRI